MFRVFRSALLNAQADKAKALNHPELAAHYEKRAKALLVEETKAQEIAAAKAALKAKMQEELAALK